MYPSKKKVTDPFKFQILSKVFSIWNKKNYYKIPAPNPKGLDLSSIDYIKSDINNYMMTEKTDGLRYFLYLGTHNGVPYSVMINHKCDIYLISVHANASYFKGTLFDGEFVQVELGNISNNSYQKILRNEYLVFDCYQWKGDTILHQPFINRYHYCVKSIYLDNTDEVDVLKNKNIDKNIIKYCEKDKIIVNIMDNVDHLLIKKKRWYSINQLQLLQKQRNNLNHKSDGIIFMNTNETVHNCVIYKWKEIHTIDLLYNIYNKQLYTTQNNKLMNVEQILKMNMNIYNTDIVKLTKTNVIVECEFYFDDGNNVRVRMVKIRQDKTEPNYITTVTDTLNIIKQNITFNLLNEMFVK